MLLQIQPPAQDSKPLLWQKSREDRSLVRGPISAVLPIFSPLPTIIYGGAAFEEGGYAFFMDILVFLLILIPLLQISVLTGQL